MEHRHEKGQGLSEYALLLVFVAVAGIAILSVFGQTVADVYDDAAEQIDAAMVSVEDAPNTDDTVRPTPLITISAYRDGSKHSPKAGERVTLTWKANPASQQVDQVRIQIFQQDGRGNWGTSPMRDFYVTGCCNTTITPLPAGNYRWRGAAHNAAGWSDFGSTRGFSVRR